MNAIKESFDNLPAAICFFNEKGLVRLMNRRMLAVGAMLLGSGIQTLGELRDALVQPPEGVKADSSMTGVYRFPDGSVLRFSEKEITGIAAEAARSVDNDFYVVITFDHAYTRL